MVKIKETLCEFTNRIFGYQISEELFQLRDNFCPTKGSIFCSISCPIELNYIAKGLSCNNALDKYPEECRKYFDKGGSNYDRNI